MSVDHFVTDFTDDGNETGRIDFAACECCYDPDLTPSYWHTCPDPACPARPFVLYLHEFPEGDFNFRRWREWRDLTDSICTDTWPAYSGAGEETDR